MSRKDLDQACSELGIEKPLVLEFIRREWVLIEHEQPREEDLARVCLILELRNDFGINDEGIPIVLHLLDQLYALRRAVTGTAARTK